MERSVRSRRGRPDTRRFMPPSLPPSQAGAGPARPFKGEILARLSDPWRHDSLGELTPQSEGVANEDVGVKAGAARIDAPAAINSDRVRFDARPFVARLITILEGCVAAAEVSVALPQRRMRN